MGTWIVTPSPLQSRDLGLCRWNCNSILDLWENLFNYNCSMRLLSRWINFHLLLLMCIREVHLNARRLKPIAIRTRCISWSITHTHASNTLALVLGIPHLLCKRIYLWHSWQTNKLLYSISRLKYRISQRMLGWKYSKRCQLQSYFIIILFSSVSTIKTCCNFNTLPVVLITFYIVFIQQFCCITYIKIINYMYLFFLL